MSIKRVFDAISALIGLVITSPLWTLAGLAVKISSSGPVLHRSVRVGKSGRPFTLYKFRSMRLTDPTEASSLTTAQDPRITRVGAVLRRTKIDELPQLINVLRGDMSLVGPRPEDPVFVADYTPSQRRVLDVRPGMTSPASIAYRNEALLLGTEASVAARTYRETIMPAKLAIELDYLTKRSFWTDLGVLARTATAFFGTPSAGIGRSQGRVG